VACRGSITTLKDGNTYKRQQRTGTRCLIKAARYLGVACVPGIATISRLAAGDFSRSGGETKRDGNSGSLVAGGLDSEI
jgi:hypothetical protein